MSIEKITVPPKPGLDHVFAYFDDTEKGAGRVILVCWDMSYTAYWGAIGERTIKEFFVGCGVDYIEGKMLGMNYKANASSLSHMRKVIKAAHDHLNTKAEAA